MPQKQSSRYKKPAKKVPPGRAKTTKKVSVPKNSGQYFALSQTEQEKWNRIVHAISKMRSGGISLTQASRDFEIDRRLVVARAGSALKKNKSGRYVVGHSDRLLRVLVIPSSEGLKEVAVRGSSAASKLAAYSDAVQRYLRIGDSFSLGKFRVMKLKDEKGRVIDLITDLAELRKLGSAGVLSFESLYARVA